MRQTIEPVTTDADGVEHHPAWALIGANRVTSTPPGAVLFDSDVRHQHYVTVTISTGVRARSLNHDRLYGQGRLIEIAMSEAQWASFVSSMNVGDGVPCTMLAREGDPMVPGMDYAPRLQESIDEVRRAAEKALEEIHEAMQTYKEKKTAENLRNLESAVRNASPNVVFAAKSLNEHAENVVQKARADIEAMMMTKAQELGLAPGDIGGLPELTRGGNDESEAD